MCPTEKMSFRQGCYRAPGQELYAMYVYLHSYDETFHHFSTLSLKQLIINVLFKEVYEQIKHWDEFNHHVSAAYCQLHMKT